jgi:L-amino acid N-acyltransferase YncA
MESVAPISEDVPQPHLEPGEVVSADSYSTRPVRPEDTQALRPILEQWVRDSETHELLSEEVESILSQIEESSQGDTGRHYLVAQDGNGTIAGIIGLTEPDEDMKAYAKTEHPLELVNFFANQKGQGAGKLLMAALEQQAVQEGATELVVNSGPRYEDSWGFYDHVLGPRVAMMKDKYGPGRDAAVWRKEIAPQIR